MTKPPRLTRDDWLREGFRALVKDGPEALKAEPLARRMKTTKGSFYWHFRDISTLHQALFDTWEARAFDEIVAAIGDEPSPQLRLRKLGQVAANAAQRGHTGLAVEPAMRAWARSEPRAAEAVARVDRRRLDYLETLLGGLGLTNPDLARVIYAALIGLEDLSSRDGGGVDQPLGTLIDVILALE